MDVCIDCKHPIGDHKARDCTITSDGPAKLLVCEEAKGRGKRLRPFRLMYFD